MSENKSTFKKIHLEWLDGMPLMCHFQSIKDVKPMDFALFLDGFVKNLVSISPKQATYVEVENGTP